MKANIPNVLTLCNLICGCVGIVFAFSGLVENAAYLIWVAAIFDFFDGFAARLLKVKSSIGKELDSLADMVSFGVLPSAIMYVLIAAKTENLVLPYLAFSVAVFSALRLAKFNIDESQSDSFIGLPTPATAFFISALPLIISQNTMDLKNYFNPAFLIGICLVLSVLMVSRIVLFSLKFKNLSWQHNVIRYIFALISVVLLLTLQILAIPVIILVYLVLSVAASMSPSTK